MSAVSFGIHDITTFQSNNTHVSLFIGHAGHNQLHCGILYKSDETPACAIHLEWHYILKNELTTSKNLANYFWVEPKIHPSRLRSVAAMCQRISDRSTERGIAYGLYYDEDSKFEDGLLSLGSKASGLTCATFILSVFSSCRITLLEVDSWPIRPEDRDWHDKVISGLESYSKASPSHIQNVKKEKGCARFRPEEVVASSTLENPPSDFEKIICRANLVKSLIEYYQTLLDYTP